MSYTFVHVHFKYCHENIRTRLPKEKGNLLIVSPPKITYLYVFWDCPITVSLFPCRKSVFHRMMPWIHLCCSDWGQDSSYWAVLPVLSLDHLTPSMQRCAEALRLQQCLKIPLTALVNVLSLIQASADCPLRAITQCSIKACMGMRSWYSLRHQCSRKITRNKKKSWQRPLQKYLCSRLHRFICASIKAHLYVVFLSLHGWVWNQEGAVSFCPVKREECNECRICFCWGNCKLLQTTVLQAAVLSSCVW